MRDPEYLRFKLEVRKSLEKQLLHFAKVEKINQIIGIKKATRELTDKELLKNLAVIWTALVFFLEEDAIAMYLHSAATKGAGSAANKLAISEEMVITNKDILSNIDKRVQKVYDVVDNTSKEWVAKSVEQGLRDGMTSVEIAKFLRDDAKRVAELRSELIAEQEAALMIGYLEMEVYKRNGVQFTKWITSRDERVCPSCSANEDVSEVPVGDEFPTGVVAPPEHLRCRCFLLPIIPLDFKVKWTGK